MIVEKSINKIQSCFTFQALTLNVMHDTTLLLLLSTSCL